MQNFSSDLGSFFRRVEIEGVIYYLRGLTTFEYADLQRRIGHQLNLAFTTELAWVIAKAGIMDWENYLDEDGETLEFDKDYVQLLDDDVVMNLASIIYKELTMLDEETEQKFKGHIRLMYYLSDEKHGATRAKTFDCNSCVKNAQYTKRKCSLPYLQEMIATIEKEKEVDLDDAKMANVQALLEQRRLKKLKRKKFQTIEEYNQSQQQDMGNALAIPGFSYPECPISWIDPWIKTTADLLYDCAKSNKQFFNGGTADQPYFLYRAQRVVGGESGKIESEQMKKK